MTTNSTQEVFKDRKTDKVAEKKDSNFRDQIYQSLPILYRKKDGTKDTERIQAVRKLLDDFRTVYRETSEVLERPENDQLRAEIFKAMAAVFRARNIEPPKEDRNYTFSSLADAMAAGYLLKPEMREELKVHPDGVAELYDDTIVEPIIEELKNTGREKFAVQLQKIMSDAAKAVFPPDEDSLEPSSGQLPDPPLFEDSPKK